MLVFEDAIVISLRPVGVSFAMRLRSRPGQLHHRPARTWRDESIRIGLRTPIVTLLGVLTIAALLRQFGIRSGCIGATPFSIAPAPARRG